VTAQPVFLQTPLGRKFLISRCSLGANAFFQLQKIQFPVGICMILSLCRGMYVQKQLGLAGAELTQIFGIHVGFINFQKAAIRAPHASGILGSRNTQVCAT